MHDFAIIGLGIYGAALSRELASRGHSVVGFDQHTPPHKFGSSHGETRIYRSVPFNGSPYVELMNISLKCLEELQSEVRQTFLTQTGGLDMGWVNGDRVQNTLKLCRAYNLPHEVLTREEVSQRFGLFNLPDDTAAVYQPSSGYLRAEQLWEALLAQAQNLGAEFHFNELIGEPNALYDKSPTILTSTGTYTARTVIVTVGAYLPSLFPEFARTIRPLRQLVAWFPSPPAVAHDASQLPVFTLKLQKRWYGFPDIDCKGIKLGWHNVGDDAVDTDPRATPALSEEETETFRRDIAAIIPALADVKPPLSKCLYAFASDENFVLWRLRENRQIHVVSCCSGHGFKYALGISKLLADEFEGRPTKVDLSLFRRE